jgi:hemerythrin-like domain-containing protein
MISIKVIPGHIRKNWLARQSPPTIEFASLKMSGFFDVSDVQDRLRADHNLQIEICSALETIADLLPQPVPFETANRLRTLLNPSWDHHVSFHERAVFPVLRRYHSCALDLCAELERLELEHTTIACAGHELAEQLEDIAEGSDSNPDMLGYMLRGVFAERRRHIEFEQRLLTVSLPVTLAPADRACFQQWWANQNWPVY